MLCKTQFSFTKCNLDIIFIVLSDEFRKKGAKYFVCPDYSVCTLEEVSGSLPVSKKWGFTMPVCYRNA
jgi:hypothetical protein